MTEPCRVPEYDREADLDEQERFSLPPDLRPRPHKFVEQTGTDECGDCSLPFAFGGLHPDEPPAEPVTAHDFQAGDVVAGEQSGSVFEVVRHRYDGLVFVPLGPVGVAQPNPPRGALLLLRDKKRAAS